MNSSRSIVSLRIPLTYEEVQKRVPSAAVVG